MKVAVRTRSKNIDYCWKTTEDESNHERWFITPGTYCDESLSAAAMREGRQAKVYLGGMSSGINDFMGTRVRMDLCIGELDEPQARALLVCFLQETGDFAAALAGNISRPDADDWFVDFHKLEEWLTDLIIKKNFGSRPAFEDAWEKDGYLKERGNRGPNPSEWKKVALELTAHSFSEEDGLKLLLTRIPNNQGEEIAREQADRLLWRTDREQDILPFRKKKPSTTGATPETRSDKASTLSSYPPSVKKATFPKPDTSRSFSNPPHTVSPKKLLIGLGVIVAIGLVGLSIYEIKKKEVKSPEVEKPRIEEKQQPIPEKQAPAPASAKPGEDGKTTPIPQETPAPPADEPR
ncbi:MAG: hypothetical protein QM680_11135 [Luteolibacter sp.]